jgi:hypothetical protein
MATQKPKPTGSRGNSLNVQIMEQKVLIAKQLDSIEQQKAKFNELKDGLNGLRAQKAAKK